MTASTPSPPTPPHVRGSQDVLDSFGVSADSGLSADAVVRLRGEYGENKLDEAGSEPAWRKIARLLADKMTIVLILAAVVSAAVSHEWETPVVILLVITLNTVLNYVQETRAEESLRALRTMSVAQSRVLRDGRQRQVSRTELVPGDIVLVEAGTRCPPTWCSWRPSVAPQRQRRRCVDWRWRTRSHRIQRWRRRWKGKTSWPMGWWCWTYPLAWTSTG